MKFITNEPALLIGKTLVVADLHIGIEAELRRAGIKAPLQTQKMFKRVEQLVQKTKAKRLVILGDVKHKVPGTSWQEEREIPHFIARLGHLVDVEIVPGNHDGGLKGVTPDLHGMSRSAARHAADPYSQGKSGILVDAEVYPSEGVGISGVWLSHGHAWPGKDFVNSEYVVVAHVHPSVEFINRLGYRWVEQVWIKARLKKSLVDKKFGKTKKLPEMILMPAFNSWAGTRPLNRKRAKEAYTGPLVKCADLPNAKVYLLDGTFLGKLKDL